MFQTKVVEKIKTHVLVSVTFYPEVVPCKDNVEKYGEPDRPQMAIQYGACALHAA
jgi:hypothetical protein